ncbi:hypothetical protein [Enterococcus mundtii]|uniref:hypothetical protein n=1 Tax=Enterococcus mundtii TaxID=53346 RepID=UPI0035BF6CBA
MTQIQDLRGDSRILGPTNAKRNVSQVTKIARHHSATPTGDVWTFQNHWNGTLGWGQAGIMKSFYAMVPFNGVTSIMM